MLKLPENASFSEVRSKMAKADAEDKHKIQHIEMRSSSFKRFEQIGTLFAFTPPTRDSWQAFLGRLDDWGKSLIAKITKLSAAEKAAQKPALPEITLRDNQSGDEQSQGPKPAPSSTGPSI